MTQELPAPLVPADCDLRGLDYMPLFGNHLFGSEFNAAATDAEWRAAVTLWWAAWNQVPAGSLPADDVALCRLADLGRDVKGWKKLRERALHGFVACSDGRLYHAFLCQQVLVAWEKRIKEREKKAKWRAEQAAKKAGQDHSVPVVSTGTETGTEPGRDRSVPADGNGRDGTGRDSIPNTSTPDGVDGARPPAEPPPLALVETPAPKPKGPPDCPHRAVLALWAEVLPQLPQHDPERWAGTRADHLRARWREEAERHGWATQDDGLVYLRRLFGYCRKSPFLMGQVKPREPGRKAFQLELEWLVMPTNWTKVHEGKFHEEAA